ncbi:MAG: leucine-rich repeat protein [Muribaculaceae bacterium]|nr:leucine-rich repeat protein [Muribaculaceae bacterium]
MKLKLLFFLLLAPLVVLAQDFIYNGVTYTVISSVDKTCRTKTGSNYWTPGNNITGKLNLYEKVEYNNEVYTLKEIGDYSFCNNSNISGELIIPESVTSIGNYAFWDCIGFTGSLLIPESVTSIGVFAFSDCRNFNGSLTIGNNVQTIGDSAFHSCYNFTGSLTIPNSVTSIEDSAFFHCSGFTGSLTIGNNVRTIGVTAFYECAGFRDSLTIGENVQTIGNSAFSGCSGFTGTLTIGNNVQTIGNSAFYGCSGFTGSLTIGNNVQTIGVSAFYGCSGFNGSLIIGENVQKIEYEAFERCWGFTDVKSLSENPPVVEWYTLRSLYDKPLYVPEKSISLYKNAEGWYFSSIEPLPVEATTIQLNKSNLTLLVGQEETLIATLSPEDTSAEITWSSSTPTVASVSTDGVVTAVSVGVANITVSCGEASATCSVTVKSGNEITVTPGDGTGSGPGDDDGNGWIDGNDVYVHVNRTVTVDLQLPDELSGIPSLTWSLANGGESLVELTPSGDTLSAAFTGLSVGETSYTVSLNGEELLTGKVTVIAEITMKSLELDPAQLSMAQNALPQTIKPVYTPSEATMPELNWESSNPAVASVDNEGNVTPHSQGQTVITCTALDGSNLSAICSVTVTAPIAESFEFEFDESVMGGKEGISLYIGDTYQFTPKAQAGYVLPDVINWISSDPTTVSVTNDGTITALALGQATITATATVNGKQVTATCEVTVIPQEPDEPEYIAETPTELLRKGDGTSHTFVAMMEKTDEVLEAAGYHYVFGYTNLKEGSVTLEDTPWRYTYTTEEVYWNPSNDFWVFAYFIDADGMLHISSRRHLDGSVDEDFNPMDFIGIKSRSGEHIIGVYTVDGNYMGKSIESLNSGIYVVKTNNSSYKIIK